MESSARHTGDCVRDAKHPGVGTCVGVDDVLSEETCHSIGSQSRTLPLKQDYCLTCVFDTEADVHDRFETLVPRPIWAVRPHQFDSKSRDPFLKHPVSRTIVAGRSEQESLVVVHQDPVWRRHSRDVVDLKLAGPTLFEGWRISWSSVSQLLSCTRDVFDEIVPEAQIVGGLGFHDGARETDGS